MEFLEGPVLALIAVRMLFVVSSLFYLVQRYRVDLQMMQQNSYRNERYFRWWRTNSDYMSPSRLVDLAVLLLLFSQFHLLVKVGVATIVFAVKGIALSRKKYKKPLVMTRRVWRLLITMLVLTVFAVIPVAVAYYYLFDIGIVTVVAVLATFSWAVTAACNWAMKPVERAINKSFIDDAKRILAQMPDMKIIGITGSYGKTSTKHYLYRILSEQYDVLMTPGSFNTPMGVVRTVREMLKPYNQVFIVEMGAKQIGDIKEICDIVHPQMAVITAVGEQHLESFKTIENVQRTKFELVDALPDDGFAVVNNDFEYVANREVNNVKAVRYAVRATEHADYVAADIEYSAFGTRFTIKGEGRSLALETRLVGECNISNLMAAVIVAMRLGVSDDKIRYAVSKIEQVEHRLNMKRTAGGVTIIDDAFNSNPDGSRMALDVLSRMKGGKRIVVTPGMIELGDKQDYHNEHFGEHIAKSVDVAIIVGQYNREAILRGLQNAGMTDEEKVITVDTFAQAQQRLSSLLASGDTVLYENDLPDTFK